MKVKGKGSVSIFTCVLYDVDIEASACILSSRYAMLCYSC